MSVDTIKNINDFSTYLDLLKELSNCLIVIAACDTVVPSPAKSNISEEDYKKLHALGLELLRADNISQQFWSGYAAVISAGRVIYEKLAEKNEEVRYDFSEKDFQINVLSSPFKNRNTASVKINGKDFAINERGLNIVVADMDSGSVLDYVCFDTWAAGISSRRKQGKPVSVQEKNSENSDAEHFDVAIYGLWYGRNYGSMMTYFALNEVIKSMGYSTVMIRNPLGTEGLKIEKLPRSHSLRFAQKHYKITPLYHLNDMKKLNQICDRFVLGSDQMWNYGLSKAYQQSYFFDFADDDKKKISYATSFGKDSYSGPDEYAALVKKNLQRFDAISVRDDFSKDICEKKFGVKAEQVLDSVFLCPREKYEELIAEATVDNKDFLFVYVLDPNPDFGKEVKAVAEKIKKKVIVIFNESGDKAEFKNRLNLDYEDVLYWEDATVNEWLYCFKNASFILTDSFHGACFSAIFEKDFIVKKNVGRGGKRFDCLLEKLGLKERMAEKITDMHNLFDKVREGGAIDYNAVHERIRGEIERDKKWLRNALEQKPVLPVSIPEKAITNYLEPGFCTGCGVCANVCPVDAITMKPNQEGFMNPAVNYDKCINCGFCALKCVSLHPQYTNNQKPDCFAFCASDEIRAVSSSGGVFSVAAEYILEKGGYVAGVVYNEDYSVRHTIISDKKDLWKMRGSKYMQSNVGNIYQEVQKLLDDGRLVLFTGLPCHAAAMYSYLGNKKYENLYTIDLVCHGITSQKVFRKFHKDVLGNKKITDLQFKAKEPWGWHAGTNVKFEDGSTYSVPLERCPYFVAYLKSIAKNTTCGMCKFNKLPRQADLTIGDFWGINKFNPQLNDGKGTSVVLVNSSQGSSLLEKIKPAAQILEAVPLQYALNGNPVMKNPYKMNRNRDYFFQNIDSQNFAELTHMCYTNDFRLLDEQFLSGLDSNLHGLYYLGKAVAQNYNGRKIVAWGEGPVSKRVLKQFFNLDIAFTVYAQGHAVNGTTSRSIDVIKGRSSEYYIVSLGHNWSAEAEKILKDLGYESEKDYLFRVHKPIVLENFDLSKGNYTDIYGNRITGSSGILKKIIFRGLNSSITLGKNVRIGKGIEFDLAVNSTVSIGDGCRFTGDVRFQMIGNNSTRSNVQIGRNCRFLSGILKLFGHEKNSAITIGDDCTFESNLELHANSGKRIVIGRDCMFSHDIDVWAGDGHSIFDVTTGKNTNSDFENIPSYKNEIVFGDHVWVSKKAFVLAGTNIGTGSVVGAQSVVKGKYPNNCIVAGNPSKIVKRDIAWSRNNAARELSAAESVYANITTNAEPPITGKKVLVIGGTKFMGIKLVEELIELGNYVTIATRGKTGDSFGRYVDRIIMDVSDNDSVKNALSGKYFDVVFDNLAVCSNHVQKILSNVSCKRYIQLSSIAAYNFRAADMKESDFKPKEGILEWCDHAVGDYGVGYGKGKRQAEIALYKSFSEISSVTVRIPYVTKTERLYYYCKCVVKEIPMKITDISRGLTFIRDSEVGKFLPWVAAQNYNGPINLASEGMITLKMIIEYIEKKTNKKAVFDSENGKQSPFNEKTFSLNLDKAKALGYKTSNIHDWFWSLLDEYITRALNEK